MSSLNFASDLNKNDIIYLIYLNNSRELKQRLFC